VLRSQRNVAFSNSDLSRRSRVPATSRISDVWEVWIEEIAPSRMVVSALHAC